jgi:hypothetical protein
VTDRFHSVVFALACLAVAAFALAVGYAVGADSAPTETRIVPVPAAAETTTTISRTRDCARPGVVCGMGDGGCVTTGAAAAARNHITPDPACGATP